jgi:hypothetical protein
VLVSGRNSGYWVKHPSLGSNIYVVRVLDALTIHGILYVLQSLTVSLLERETRFNDATRVVVAV